MRLATYRRNDGPRLGVVRGEQILDVASLEGFASTTDMMSLLDQGPAGLTRLRAAVGALRIATGLAETATVRREGAPIPIRPLPRCRSN